MLTRVRVSMAPGDSISFGIPEKTCPLEDEAGRLQGVVEILCVLD
jgi:hypothetical protein